jgi:hypothetical protein
VSVDEVGRVGVVYTVATHARRLLVFIQVATQSESLTTPATDVRLVCRVRLNVRTQVGLVGERFAAVRAAERLLTRVGSYVSLEQPGP